MCGICGYVGAREDGILPLMKRAIAHRGPDGAGEYHHEALGVHFGHQRLAILDIEGGAQPLTNEDGTVVVVYNGEIYNHLELRAELQALGHRFSTHHCDTEVLVHGYEEWGTGLLTRLNGMFAFAVFDSVRRRLFLARDRFGEKPLYWASDRSFFAFASEVHALAQHPRIGAEPNPRSLQKFFAYGYLPAGHSLLERTHKLPAGHFLVYDIDRAAVEIKRYWTFTIEPDESLTYANDDRLAEELRALIVQAVRRRLISDVPLGLFLSGGIDSSTILAAAIQSKPAEELSTFTIGFEESSFDESGYARETASFFGSQHHQQILDVNAAPPLVGETLAKLDEPLGDASLIPTYMLARFTKQHVKVALSGDGGDELFAGYDPFKALSAARAYSNVVPARLHTGIRHAIDCLPVSHANMSLDFKLKRALAGLSYPRELWNPVWLAPVEPAAMKELFHEPLCSEELYSEALDLWNRTSTSNLVDKTLEFYTNLYLQDDILMKADRASMMHSLESRAVFLDNDIVEFCRRLPHWFKQRNGERKFLLRKAMEGLLPKSVLQRRKKGFGMPISKWLRNKAVAVPHTGLPGARESWITRQLHEHQLGRKDNRLFLWSWLSLHTSLSKYGCT